MPFLSWQHISSSRSPFLRQYFTHKFLKSPAVFNTVNRDRTSYPPRNIYYASSISYDPVRLLFLQFHENPLPKLFSESMLIILFHSNVLFSLPFLFFQFSPSSWAKQCNAYNFSEPN